MMCPWIGSQAGSPSAASRGAPSEAAGRGFTLVEVLVAFVILSLALGVVMTQFSLGFSTIDRVGNRVEAALLGVSKLEALGRSEPLEPGETSGRFDDAFRWNMVIRPSPTDDSELAPEDLDLGVLYDVVLEIEWREARQSASLTLFSRRLLGSSS